MNTENPLEEIRNLSRTVAKKQQEQKKREEYSRRTYTATAAVRVSEKRQKLESEIKDAERAVKKAVLVNKSLLIMMIGLAILTGLYYYKKQVKENSLHLNIPEKEMIPKDSSEYICAKSFAEKVVKTFLYKGADDLAPLWASFVPEDTKYYSVAILKKIKTADELQITDIFRYKGYEDIFHIRYAFIETDEHFVITLKKEENKKLKLVSIE